MTRLSEMNKSDSDQQKRSSVFQEKINTDDTAELTGDDKKRSPDFFQEKNRVETVSCRLG